jgi:hypothetical protein
MVKTKLQIDVEGSRVSTISGTGEVKITVG